MKTLLDLIKRLLNLKLWENDSRKKEYERGYAYGAVKLLSSNGMNSGIDPHSAFDYPNEFDRGIWAAEMDFLAILDDENPKSIRAEFLRK
jgi:hypothetical protein